jgi:DNA (cytosine-5)-methyltransferase 1
MLMPGTLLSMRGLKAGADRNLPVPVVDLFAGPGGLSEGFSAFEEKGRRPFDVRLSIEKDAVACATLRLRALFRQFSVPPQSILDYMEGRMPLSEVVSDHSAEAAAAEQVVWNAELGKVSPNTVARAIRKRIGSERNWVLLGGPPCQAYSIAGRSRMRTTRPDFEFDERHFLYREYLRIVADHEPTVFVLENVKGLITSRHGGDRIVTRILDDLSEPAKAIGSKRQEPRGYRLYALAQRQASLPWTGSDPQDGEDFILRAEEFGIPQMRHRLFIVGVRTDIRGRPGTLHGRPAVSTGDVLSDLPRLRSQLSREDDSTAAWQSAVAEILNHDWMSGPTDKPMTSVRRAIRTAVAELQRVELTPGSMYVRHAGAPRALGDWYRRHSVGLTQHVTRAHMTSDLHRYLFAAAFAKVHLRSPELQNFPKKLRPAHKNIELALRGEMFNDRFRVQLEDRPSTTITSHISKDGHYYIHYDPVQCRSLTLREAARLQTFPDDYFFEGNRTEQYHQVGNAVPPLLALDIARAIYELLSGAGLIDSEPAGAARRVSGTRRKPDRAGLAPQ